VKQNHQFSELLGVDLDSSRKLFSTSSLRRNCPNCFTCPVQGAKGMIITVTQSLPSPNFFSCWALVAHVCNHQRSGGSWFKASLEQIVLKTLSQEYPVPKRIGRVAEVVKCLPSKCEALSSNLTATKISK
jgi:hypothetical protein